MTNVRKLPPSELDLQAYLDDELTPEERLPIIEWLLENPARAQELFEVQLREDLLRVAVKLSLKDAPALGLSSETNHEKQTVDFARYDRFLFGFAAAAGICALIFLITNAVS